VCRRRPLTVASVAAGAALSLLAAGCGGGSPVAGVASSRTTAQTGLIGYSRCMRSHGASTFPDPDSSGQIPKSQVIAARKDNPSRFDSATSACRPLLPSGSLGPQGQITITATDRSDYLKAAACMRSHGFPNFPDPTFQDNTVETNIPSSIDQNSSQFTSAAETCTKLIPAGLPDSHRSG
jgi:hypothetical protein